MQTVTFKSVLHGLATSVGLDPLLNLLADQAAAFTVYINDRLKEAWESYDWPELTLIEERAYRDAYAAATTYAIGDEVYYATTGKYYEAIAVTTGNLPTDATKWSELTSFERYVAYQQTGKTKLGEVFGVWTKDPRVNRAPGELGYDLNEKGVLVDFDAPATVWVEFQLRPAEFTSVPWAAATAYVADNLVYLDSTGEVYRALQASTNQTPPNATYWAKVDFPYVLAPFVKAAGKADVLREEGQEDAAIRQEGRAGKLLMDAYDNLEMRQNRRRHFSVRTG